MRLIVSVVLALTGASAGEAAPLSEKPGLHPLVGFGAHTASVYIPSGYVKEDSQQYPLLVCQHPGGKPGGDVAKWGPWADRFQVVVVGINGPSNDMAGHLKGPIQDGVVKGVESVLRIHPRLRFTSGVSGGAADGSRFARRKPQQFDGLCLVAVATGQTHGITLGTLSYGIVHGAKDGICQGEGVLTTQAQRLLANGSTIRWNLHQMGGHTGGPKGAHEEMMTWLLWNGRLAPHRTPEELREGRAQAAAWATMLLTEPDPQRRKVESTLFLELPTEDVPGRDALAARWLSDLMTSSATAPAMERVALLSDALAGERWDATTYGKGASASQCWIVTRNHALINSGLRIPEQVRNTVTTARDALLLDPVVAKDWNLRLGLRAIILKEIDAGLGFDASKVAFKAYEAFAKTDPEHRWCKEAGQHGARLRSYWERKSPEGQAARSATATAPAPSEPTGSNDGSQPAPGAP